MDGKQKGDVLMNVKWTPEMEIACAVGSCLGVQPLEPSRESCGSQTATAICS